jgi:hypothetical protein
MDRCPGIKVAGIQSMPKQDLAEQHGESERQERQEMNAKIGVHVMHALGKPGDLHGVQIRRLWKDHYRVNVLVGVDAASAKVAHSFFLIADSNGNILASTPAITKKYRPLVGEIMSQGP